MSLRVRVSVSMAPWDSTCDTTHHLPCSLTASPLNLFSCLLRDTELRVLDCKESLFQEVIGFRKHESSSY